MIHAVRKYVYALYRGIQGPNCWVGGFTCNMYGPCQAWHCAPFSPYPFVRPHPLATRPTCIEILPRYQDYFFGVIEQA